MSSLEFLNSLCQFPQESSNSIKDCNFPEWTEVQDINQSFDMYKNFLSEWSFKEQLGGSIRNKILLVHHRVTGLPAIVKISYNLQKNQFQKMHRQWEEQFLKTVQISSVVKVYLVKLEKQSMIRVVEFVGRELKLQTSYYTNHPIRKYSQNHIIWVSSTIKKLLEAISQLHDKGYIHRDLKLQNIFLDSSNNIILNDFEFVIPIGAIDPSLCGSLQYCPPERLCSKSRFNQPVQCSVDCWAIGIITYKMIHGFVPFKGTTPKSLLQQIYEGYFSYEQQVPQNVYCFIQQALEINRNKRATIQDLKKHQFLQKK